MTFEELYHTYYKQIFRFCFRYVGSSALAKDLSQDAFLKLYQRMKKNRQTVINPQAWLYKVAANLCLNKLKMDQRRGIKPLGFQTKLADGNTPESLFIKQEQVEHIRGLLARLNPEHRMLLLMYQDGLSYKEMSDATGIPLNSIGQTLWRSIRKLSEWMKKTNNE